MHKFIRAYDDQPTIPAHDDRKRILSTISELSELNCEFLTFLESDQMRIIKWFTIRFALVVGLALLNCFLVGCWGKPLMQVNLDAGLWIRSGQAPTAAEYRQQWNLYQNTK